MIRPSIPWTTFFRSLRTFSEASPRASQSLSTNVEAAVRSDERGLREEAEGRAQAAHELAVEANTRAEAADARLLRLESVARIRAIRVAKTAGRIAWVVLMALVTLGAYAAFPGDLRVV